MSEISIFLGAPLLPDGAEVRMTINRGQVKSGLAELAEAVSGVFQEADRCNVSTPAERALGDRLAMIEKAILAGLPADVKLELANQKLHG